MEAIQRMREVELMSLEMARIAKQSLLAMQTRFSDAGVINSLDSICDSMTQIAQHNERLNQISKLDKFLHFPELPIEIRLKVWKILMHRSRLVELFYEPSYGLAGRLQQIPIVLQICSESRAEGLKKYSLRLDVYRMNCYTRIDPDQDRILLLESDGRIHPNDEGYRPKTSKARHILFGKILKPSVLKSIKHLMIDRDVFGPSDFRADTLWTGYSQRIRGTRESGYSWPLQHFQRRLCFYRGHET